MEVIGEMTLGRSKGTSDKTELFQKVDGAMFCEVCGKQYSETEFQENENRCHICNNDKDFIKGDFASVLAGYIQLNKRGKLKEYYKQRTKKTGKTMNVRRLVIWLLVKDGFIVPADREAENMIYRTLWKGW